MLRKKLLLLVMLVALLVSLSTPGVVSASCSGDDCGCNIEAAACREECKLEYPSHPLPCINVCIHESLACAVACCIP